MIIPEPLASEVLAVWDRDGERAAHRLLARRTSLGLVARHLAIQALLDDRGGRAG